jgi:hypothetical protein
MVTAECLHHCSISSGNCAGLLSPRQGSASSSWHTFLSANLHITAAATACEPTHALLTCLPAFMWLCCIHRALQKARAMLEAYDAAMAPLTAQLAACEGLTPPDFLSYNGWVHNEIAIRQRVQSK